MKAIIRLQLLLLGLAYVGLLGWLLTRTYDPRWVNVMVGGRISLFWLIHGIGLGIVLALVMRWIARLDARLVVFWQILIVILLLTTALATETVFRLSPKILPYPVLKELGVTLEDLSREEVNYVLESRYRHDPLLAFINKPYLKYGLKTGEFSYLYQSDKYGFTNSHDESLYDQADIVTIGDSFTEGVGVAHEDSYPRVLARMLNRRVLNLGHGGYDLYQFPLVYNIFALKARPRLVVVSIYSYNDLQDAFFDWKAWCDQNRYVEYKTEWPQIDPSVERIKPRTYIGAWLKYVGRQIHYKFEQYQATVFKSGRCRGLTINGQHILACLDSMRVYEGHDLDVKLQRLDRFLMKMQEYSREYDFQLLMLYIPQKQFVYQQFLPEVAPADRDNEQMKARILETIQRRGVDVIDTSTPLIEAMDRGEMVYFLKDIHLNERGYAIVAELVAAYERNRHAD